MSFDDSILGSREEEKGNLLPQFMALVKQSDMMRSIESWIRAQKGMICEAAKGGDTKEKELNRFMQKTLKEISRMEEHVLKARYRTSIDLASCTARLSKEQGHVMKSGYMDALADKLKPLKGAQFQMQPSGGRKSSDQDTWKARLRKAYAAPDSEDHEECWDPVLARYQDIHCLTAAHIVPYALGEDHAANIFGVEPVHGYDIIWGVENGLLLHPVIEAAMDSGRLVIVPDPTDASSWRKHLRVVVLDEKLKEEPIERATPALGTFGSLDLKRLEWPDHIKIRPKRRFLYFLFLMTLFRRRRYNVAGWEQDRNKFPRQIWATPDKWLQRSLLVELAKEIGDISPDDDFLKERLASFSGSLFGKEVTAEQALQVRAAFEIPGDVEDMAID